MLEFDHATDILIRLRRIHQALGVTPRSLVRWRKHLDTKGAPSFYLPRGGRGAAVLTAGLGEEELNLDDASVRV